MTAKKKQTANKQVEKKSSTSKKVIKASAIKIPYVVSDDEGDSYRLPIVLHDQPGTFKDLECTKQVYQKTIKNQYPRSFRSDFNLEMDPETDTVLYITDTPKQEELDSRLSRLDDTQQEGTNSSPNKVILQIHDTDSVSVKYSPPNLSPDIVDEILKYADASESIQLHDFLGDKYLVEDIRTSLENKYIHVSPKVS